MKTSTFLAILPLFLLFKASTSNAATNLVSFHYESYDGVATAACSHAVSNPQNPYDLTVKCSDGKSVKKEFLVHLALSRYRHQTAPRVTYELLYWVNGNGATSWYHFDEETNLNKVESAQSITGEDASLKLSITLQ